MRKPTRRPPDLPLLDEYLVLEAMFMAEDYDKKFILFYTLPLHNCGAALLGELYRFIAPVFEDGERELDHYGYVVAGERGLVDNVAAEETIYVRVEGDKAVLAYINERHFRGLVEKCRVKMYKHYRLLDDAAELGDVVDSILGSKPHYTFP